MSVEKKMIILEICYDLIARIHSDLCNDAKLSRESDITDETMDILRKLIMLSRRIEQECCDDR